MNFKNLFKKFISLFRKEPEYGPAMLVNLAEEILEEPEDLGPSVPHLPPHWLVDYSKEGWSAQIGAKLLVKDAEGDIKATLKTIGDLSSQNAELREQVRKLSRSIKAHRKAVFRYMWSVVRMLRHE